MSPCLPASFRVVLATDPEPISGRLITKVVPPRQEAVPPARLELRHRKDSLAQADLSARRRHRLPVVSRRSGPRRDAVRYGHAVPAHHHIPGRRDARLVLRLNGALMSGGFTVGALFCGTLLSLLSWRAVFFINVLVPVIVVVLTPLLISETKVPDRVKLDVPARSP